MVFYLGLNSKDREITACGKWRKAGKVRGSLAGPLPATSVLTKKWETNHTNQGLFGEKWNKQVLNRKKLFPEGLWKEKDFNWILK